MIRTTLDRRLKQLEASLTPAVQQGITLIIISTATGEIIDLASPNTFAPPTSCQSASSGIEVDIHDRGAPRIINETILHARRL